MVWAGDGAIEQVRAMNGATNCQKAAQGSIRGDMGLSLTYNLVHASDSPETAQREIALYFDESEFSEYTMPDEQWLGA
jgi:nucleoside-diphosphate kinase